MRRRAVFLDRDGVINRALVRDGKPYAPRSLAEFRLLPGARAGIERLRAAGLAVIVVTNQPDIGNGLVSEAAVAAMHERLRRRLPVSDVRVCPHRQSAGCVCRKPQPGMLLAAAHDLDIDLAASFMVGDRHSDVLASRAAGCYTLFIDRGYAETRGLSIPADAIVRSLPAAVRHILSRLEASPLAREPGATSRR
jgi:D-glycero-D-manno-heptose 1,7-bisphosphate phosphatase